MKKILILVLTFVTFNSVFASEWRCTNKNRAILEDQRDRIFNYIAESEEVEEILDWVDVRTPLHSLTKESQKALGEQYAKDGIDGLERLDKKISEVANLKKNASIAISRLRNAIKYGKQNLESYDELKGNCDTIIVGERMTRGAAETRQDIEVYETHLRGVKKISRDLYRDLEIYRGYDEMINKRNFGALVE